MISVQCRLSGETKKVVRFNLRRRVQTPKPHQEGYPPAAVVPDINIRQVFDRDDLFLSGAVSTWAHRSDIPSDADMAKISRGIEARLGKSAIREDIIRIALSRGAKLRQQHGFPPIPIAVGKALARLCFEPHDNNSRFPSGTAMYSPMGMEPVNGCDSEAGFFFGGHHGPSGSGRLGT